MNNEPSVTDLLALAVDSLEQNLIPGLVGHQRFIATMVARAIEIASQEVLSDVCNRTAALGTSAIPEQLSSWPHADGEPITATRDLRQLIRSGYFDEAASNSLLRRYIGTVSGIER